MLKPYRVDLHIHTCLSPCADLTMSPKRVVERAVKKKIDIIGICDHNSAENVRAAVAAAADKQITVLPGMEITSVEEVHILGLFDEIAPVLFLQEIVFEHLAPGGNNEEVFGEQIIANEFDEVEGYNPRLLLGATSLTLKEVVAEIHAMGGIAVAAHIDREAFSILGQLGFIPENLDLDALEVSLVTPACAVEMFPGIHHFPLIRSSDAHELEDIGSQVSRFLLEEPTFDEIRKAFDKRAGRALLMEI
jgi:predicted metal-dependent phosphoesterase TrpH